MWPDVTNKGNEEMSERGWQGPVLGGHAKEFGLHPRCNGNRLESGDI